MTSFTWRRPGEEFLEPYTVHQITFHHASCLVQGLGEESSSLLLSIIVALSLVLALYIPFTPEQSSNIDAKPPFRYASACLRKITTTSAISTCYHTLQAQERVSTAHRELLPALVSTAADDHYSASGRNTAFRLQKLEQTLTQRDLTACCLVQQVPYTLQSWSAIATAPRVPNNLIEAELHAGRFDELGRSTFRQLPHSVREMQTRTSNNGREEM